MPASSPIRVDVLDDVAYVRLAFIEPGRLRPDSACRRPLQGIDVPTVITQRARRALAYSRGRAAALQVSRVDCYASKPDRFNHHGRLQSGVCPALLNLERVALDLHGLGADCHR